MERRRRAKPHLWTHVVLAAHAVAAPAARHARLDGNSVPGDEVGDALAASVGVNMCQRHKILSLPEHGFDLHISSV